ncbi:MAG: Wzz/FepE/Etk N-terminal domain-containing protein [Hyphomicrobium sp.]
MQDLIREYLVLALNMLRRRWRLLFWPIVLATALGAAAVIMMPKKYVSTSLILLQSANRGAGQAPSNSFGRERALMQVAAVNAWIKSDQVLTSLLPQLLDGQDVTDPAVIYAAINVLRASLSLELLDGSTLEVRLAGGSPNGLARKLEIIVGRIMEGLTGPDQSILNASQFLTIRAREDVASSYQTLTREIAKAGFKDVDATIEELGRMSGVSVRAAAAQGSGPAVSGNNDAAGVAAPQGGAAGDQKDDAALREQLAKLPAVGSLQRLFESYWRAKTRAEALGVADRQPHFGGTNWVGIFDSPGNLLLIGRPQDPLYGESPAKKLAVAGILLGAFGGAGLILLVELLAARIKTRSEFEAIAGIPVIARLCKLPGPARPLRLRPRGFGRKNVARDLSAPIEAGAVSREG